MATAVAVVEGVNFLLERGVAVVEAQGREARREGVLVVGLPLTRKRFVTSAALASLIGRIEMGVTNILSPKEVAAVRMHREVHFFLVAALERAAAETLALERRARRCRGLRASPAALPPPPLLLLPFPLHHVAVKGGVCAPGSHPRAAPYPLT